jgi:pimeloyl-ACP methyl ester carboxylesterase
MDAFDPNLIDRNVVTGAGKAEGGARGQMLGRRYVGPPGRQTHLLEGGAPSDKTPLWCLHATAYSGRSFTPFLNLLAAHRRVVAPDTCGYGGSDGPDAPLDIQGYAQRVLEAVDQAGDTQIDLLGYHTGALIAAELARVAPERVRRLVLIGVPYLDKAEQPAWRERLASPMVLGESLDQFEERWDFLVRERDPRISLERAFNNFVDELRAYPQGWRAHDAAFTFDVQTCFARVHQPTLILNPDNHLSAPSRRAAAALPDARLVELPQLTNGIFDAAPDVLLAAAEAFLEEDLDAAPTVHIRAAQ